MRDSGEWQGAFQNYPVDCHDEFRTFRSSYSFDNELQCYIPNGYQGVPNHSYPMQSPYYNRIDFDGRVPPFHPDDCPSERQPWSGHQLNRPYQNEAYARNSKTFRRRRSHLHDIWGPNFDSEDEVRERNGNPTGSYPSYNSYGPRNCFDNDRPRFMDRNDNRFRVKNKNYPKNKNANRVASVCVERSSSSSTNVEKVKPDDPKIEIADSELKNDDKLENKQLSGKDLNLSDISENSTCPNNEQDTTLISSEAKISSNEIMNVESPDIGEQPTFLEKTSNAQSNPDNKTVNDSDPSVDIETMLQELENSDQNSFSINDIDKFKSFLDPYSFSDDVSVVDMDLESPVSKKLKPHFTDDELEKELSGLERTHTNINKVQETSSKEPRFNHSRRFSSEVENIGLDKKELQENSGRSKIRKRRFTTIDVSDEKNLYYGQRRDSNKSPEPNIKKRCYRTNAESVPGSVERRDSLIEPIDETKRSTFFPNLRQGYKIPKNKPFSEPGKPFTSTVSLISQISQKDDKFSKELYRTKNSLDNILQETKKTCPKTSDNSRENNSIGEKHAFKTNNKRTTHKNEINTDKTKDNSFAISPKEDLIKPKSEVHSIKETANPNIHLKRKSPHTLQSSSTDKVKSTKKSMLSKLSFKKLKQTEIEKKNKKFIEGLRDDIPLNSKLDTSGILLQQDDTNSSVNGGTDCLVKNKPEILSTRKKSGGATNKVCQRKVSLQNQTSEASDPENILENEQTKDDTAYDPSLNTKIILEKVNETNLRTKKDNSTVTWVSSEETNSYENVESRNSDAYLPSCKRTGKSNSVANSTGSERINISKLCHKILSNNKPPEVETDKNIFENVKTKNRNTSDHSKAKKIKKVDSQHLENIKVTGKYNVVTSDNLNLIANIDENVQSKHDISGNYSKNISETVKTKNDTRRLSFNTKKLEVNKEKLPKLNTKEKDNSVTMLVTSEKITKSSTDKVCHKRTNNIEASENEADKIVIENIKTNKDHPGKNTKNMKINNVSSEKPNRKLDIKTDKNVKSRIDTNSDQLIKKINDSDFATTGKDDSNVVSSEKRNDKFDAKTNQIEETNISSDCSKNTCESEKTKKDSLNDQSIQKIDNVHLLSSKTAEVVNSNAVNSQKQNDKFDAIINEIEQIKRNISSDHSKNIRGSEKTKNGATSDQRKIDNVHLPSSGTTGLDNSKATSSEKQNDKFDAKTNKIEQTKRNMTSDYPKNTCESEKTKKDGTSNLYMQKIDKLHFLSSKIAEVDNSKVVNSEKQNDKLDAKTNEIEQIKRNISSDYSKNICESGKTKNDTTSDQKIDNAHLQCATGLDNSKATSSEKGNDKFDAKSNKIEQIKRNISSDYPKNTCESVKSNNDTTCDQHIQKTYNVHLQISNTTGIDNSKAVRSEKPKDAIDSETDKSIESKSHSSNDLGINKNKSTDKTDINNIKCTLDQMLQDFNIRSSAKLLEHTACSVDENMKKLSNSQPMIQIKNESSNTSNFILQICSAFKSECPQPEKYEVLTLNPYPVLQKGRLISVESECLDEAVLLESPEIRNETETIQDDVIEIREKVDIIDLTDDITDESTNTTPDSMNNIDNLKQEVLYPILNAQSSEIITMYRDEETQNENEEFLAISASFLPSAGPTGRVKPENNCAQQESCTNNENTVNPKELNINYENNCAQQESRTNNENTVNPKESKINKLEAMIDRLDTMNTGEQVNKVHGYKTIANSNLNIAQNVSSEPNLSSPMPNAMLTLETGVPNKEQNISCNIRTSLCQKTCTVSNAACNDYLRISQYDVSAKGVESTVNVPIHGSRASIISGSHILSAPVNPNKSNVPPQPVQITPDNENNRTNQNANGSPVGVMSAGNENNRTNQNADGCPVGVVPAVQTSFSGYFRKSSVLPVGVLHSPSKPNVVYKNTVPSQTVPYTPGNENNRTNQNADGSPVGVVSAVQTSFCESNTFVTSKPHSSGCLQDFESSRTNTQDQSRSQPPSNKTPNLPIHRFSLCSSWERCIAELIFLAIQYGKTCEETIKTFSSKNVANFLYQDEVKFLRSVKSHRIEYLSNKMKYVLSEIRVTECDPNHVIPIIIDFLKLYGVDSQALFYFFFDAMMMLNEKFYVNNANLRNLFSTVHATSTAIKAKQRDISNATGTLTEEQLSTLNRQIEFCNMITSYLRQNQQIQSRISNYISNFVPQTSPLQQRVVQNMNTTNMSNPNSVGRSSNLQQSQLSSSSSLQDNSPGQQGVKGFRLRDILASSALPQSPTYYANNSNQNTPNGVTNETIFNKHSRVLVPPSSQMNIGSQYLYKHPDSRQNIRFVRRILKPSSTPGSGPASSTPMSSLSTFGTLPYFNTFTSSRQISPNGVQSSLREETPIHSQQSVNQNRRHIYAPMLFSPTYVREPVVSPNTDSSGYHSSNDSPVNSVPAGTESPITPSPNNESGINQSSVNISTLPRQPDDEINSSTNVSQTSVIKSSDVRPNSDSSPRNKTPLAPTPAPSPLDESVGNVCLKKELSEVNNEIQKDANNENPVIIDLTWLDNMDSEQLKQELDFIKHEELDEDEVVLNEEQFPLVDTDDLYEGRLCICEKQALLLCECRAVMYCGRACQKRDWAKHKQLCLQEMARVQK